LSHPVHTSLIGASSHDVTRTLLSRAVFPIRG